eukprot:jgi/Ulvmu1/9410/UM051_0038.1
MRCVNTPLSGGRVVRPKGLWGHRTRAQTQEQAASTSFVDAELDAAPDKIARLAATKVEVRQVEEAERPLGEYMALPASQYSVLDGAKVERLSEDTFRVFVGVISFFNFELEPVLTLMVKPTDSGCIIEMLACKLRGSDLIESQNCKFSARMKNVVEWRDTSSPGAKEIASDTTISVDLAIPAWFVLPKAVVRSTGNTVIAAILSASVPRFLQQLEKDYAAWAAGDDSRQPLGNGELL